MTTGLVQQTVQITASRDLTLFVRKKMLGMMGQPVHFQSNLSNVGTPVVRLKFCAMHSTHIGDKRPAPRGTNFHSVDKHHAVVLVRLHPLVSKKSLDFNAVDSSQSRGS